jgi:tetratricopeptide (TPR) repeat protein
VFVAAAAIALAAALPARGQSSRSPIMEAGWQALQNGEADTAASAFRRALAERPNDAAAHLGAGAAAHMLGRDAEACEHLQKALELEPRLTPASALLGAIAYNQGNLELAIRTYERALVHAPRDSSLREQLNVWKNEASKTRYTNGPFTIMFEGPAEERLAAHAAAVLDSAYWRIAKKLATYPSEPISVVLYTERQFHDVTGAPEWSDGSFDTRIRIPVGGALKSTTEFDRVLTHELAHAVIASLAPRGVPAWLHEGLAVHLEPQDATAAEQRLTTAGAFVPLAMLSDSFSGLTDAQARLAYDESAVAVRALVTRIGGGNVGLLLQAIGRGEEFDAAVEQFGFTAAQFESDLKHRIKDARSSRP